MNTPNLILNIQLHFFVLKFNLLPFFGEFLFLFLIPFDSSLHLFVTILPLEILKSVHPFSDTDP